MSERRGFKGLNAYLHDPKLCIEHMSGLGSASIRSPVVPSLSNPGSSDQSKNDSLPAAIGSFMILIVIVLIVAFVSKARHDPRPVNQPTSDNYYAKAFAESLPVGNSSEKTTAEELTKNQPALKPGYQEKSRISIISVGFTATTKFATVLLRRFELGRLMGLWICITT